MTKITQTLTIFLFLIVVNTFSQNKKNGNREATIFYPTINKVEKKYDISVELYELGSTKYIEAELYDENEVKLDYKLYELVFKNKKYYMFEEGSAEKEVVIYDINFYLESENSGINYPKVKINILDNNYRVLDYSQKIFY